MKQKEIVSWQQCDDMPRVKRMPSIELEADATVGGASVVRMNGHVTKGIRPYALCHHASLLRSIATLGGSSAWVELVNRKKGVFALMRRLRRCTERSQPGRVLLQQLEHGQCRWFRRVLFIEWQRVAAFRSASLTC